MQAGEMQTGEVQTGEMQIDIRLIMPVFKSGAAQIAAPERDSRHGFGLTT